jgi:hypothetical protein
MYHRVGPESASPHPWSMKRGHHDHPPDQLPILVQIVASSIIRLISHLCLKVNLSMLHDQI